MNTKQKINEDWQQALLYTIPLLGGFFTALDLASYYDDREESYINDWIIKLKAKWKNFKYKREVQPIINRLKGDPEIKDFLNKSPKEQQGGWKQLIAKKLTDKEKKYLNQIYKKPFKQTEMKKNINESKRLQELAGIESNDHEVAMAISSLKEIISNATQLMQKLGDMERNIPGWIQDHITNAENYIEQANQGFHEL